MTKFYILKDREVEESPAHSRWAEFFDVRENYVVGDNHYREARVLTVFDGIDFMDSRLPTLFETIVYGGQYHLRSWRSATWDEAEKQHEFACALVSVGG